MESGKSRSDVAVFVDFENVYVSVREKFDAQPNFELIMDRCEDFGRIVIARAYADWYRYPRVTSALFANGVEPMYVPTYYYDREVGRTGRPIKNSVDIHLCIDAMRTLYTQTHLDKFVLVTGDRDFIPLVNAIRQHGKEVIIIGIGGAASAHLAQSSDEFLFYEQIADLKPPQAAREQAGRGERRERSETNGRGDGRRERERTPRAQTPTPEPSAELPVASSEVTPEGAAAEEAGTAVRTPYDTLVDAINLARQRGFVSNLGSLKVLMRELDSDFNESKVRDANGKAFQKFKDFVKEAERQGRVQIFTNGTVTEVFLPGEDPMRVSQFADELAERQAERELENELDREVELGEAEAPTALPAQPERNGAESGEPDRGAQGRGTARRSRRRGAPRESHSIDFPSPAESAALPEQPELAEAGMVDDPSLLTDSEIASPYELPAAEFADGDVNGLESYAEPGDLELPETAAVMSGWSEPVDSEPPADTQEPAAADEPAPEFGEREWEIFRSSMAQFNDPVRFADIFSALRGLRNQEVLGLTNNELKELVKQAINRGMLQRTGRGARAYYRLTTHYRTAPAESGVGEAATSLPEGSETELDTSSDTAVGLVDAGGRAADAAQEPADVSGAVEPGGDAVLEGMQAAGLTPAVAEPAPVDPMSGPQATIDELIADEVAVQSVDTPTPKARRNRRRKKSDEAASEGAATAAEATQAPPERPETAAVAAPAEEPTAPEAPKKRRTRRKPAADTQ